MTNYPRGVTCDVVRIRLELYLERTLLWSEALEVAEHLQACPPCSGRLELLRATFVVRSGAVERANEGRTGA
jgi:hypothetical protein